MHSPVIGHGEEYHMQFREVEFNGQKIITIFNSRTSSLLGVEDYANREQLFKNMHGDLIHEQDKANTLFDSLLKTSQEEYAALNGSTDFSKYKYPSLLSYIHTNNEIKLKRTLRHIVISKLKKDAKRISTIL